MREVTVEEDIVYAETTRPLRWDVYRSHCSSGVRPAVIVLHGGGWRAGSRKDMAQACSALALQGFVAVAAEYRLLGEAPWPAPLEDVAQALSALRARASEMDVSPSQFFLTGYSAGAHLSLLAAAQDPDVAGVAAFFPPVRIGERQAGLLGIDGEAVAQASPITHVRNLPPTILITGDDDELTPAPGALEFYSAMRAAGRVADLQLLSGLPHEFVKLPGMMDSTITTAAAFFRRTAIDKDGFAVAEGELRDWWRTILPSLTPASAAQPDAAEADPITPDSALSPSRTAG